MDINTLTRGNEDFIEAKKIFYKLLFHLLQRPEVFSQCCYEDPRTEYKKGRNCTNDMLSAAQDKLNAGIPVVIELFGRRKTDKKGYLHDTIMVYVPGQVIQKDLLGRTVMEQQSFEVEDPFK